MYRSVPSGILTSCDAWPSARPTSLSSRGTSSARRSTDASSGIAMAGQHLPADHSRGDTNTVGGYAAVHGRPAAFEGSDGLSYSVEIVTASTGDSSQPWGAYLLFVRWTRIGATSPSGHLESEFLAESDDESDARAIVGAMSLS